MLPSQILLLLMSFVPLIEAEPKATSSFSNATTTALKSVTTPVCCFVVQDTVTEEWFDMTSYSTTHSVVNLTSITTYVTPYPNTTKTAFETNVYTTNATFNFTILDGQNPITIMTNGAPGPAETTIRNQNGTAVITGGMTLESPGAFYVYNMVKVITAAAVTGKDGHESCATPSSFPTQGGFDDGDNGKGPIPTFIVNGNAQAYFGGPDIDGDVQKPTTTETDTFTYTITYDESTPAFTTTEIDTLIFTNDGAFYTNSKGDIVTQGERPTGVTISLVTPFVYAPARGAAGETGEGRQCLQSGESVNYGYVPQSLINFLGSNEQYKSQYPGIESCLPGGPSILQIKHCESVLPTSLDAGGDLTSGTIITITPTPEPVQQPTATEKPAPKPTTTWTSSDTYPTTQHAATELIPATSWTSSDTYPTTQHAATELIPTTSTSDTYPTTQMPATNLLPITAGNSPAPPALNPPAGETTPPNVSKFPGTTPPGAQLTNAPIGSIINSFVNGQPGGNSPTPVIIPGPTTIPVSEAPPGLTGPTTVINGTPFIVVPAATTILPPTAQPLPSGLGTTTTINGTPFLVIPSATTVPAAGLPSGLGSTTIISGTPFVVIQPTTVPIPANPQPGSITVISGTTDLVIAGPTTIPVNPNFSVDGITTVISGTTEVIVASATTVPVSGGFGPSQSEPVIPFTGAAGRNGIRGWWMGGVVLVVAVVVS